MHPAVSVIFFTVTSGAGLGLIFCLGLGWPMPASPLAAFLVSLLAGGLTAAGLISSTFHLGHPERAWRALSQWRSSWLSREGVSAILTLTLLGIYALVWMMTGERVAWLGLLISLFAAITVFTTAMIYAQLKTVPDWHSALTPACYLAFALAAGALLAAGLGTATTLIGMPVAILASAALIVAWTAKLLWWNRAGTIGFSHTGSSIGTATGLGGLGAVRLLERPHSGENYLTREMVHKIGRKHAARLRRIALVTGCAVPLALCFLAMATGQPAFLFLLAFASLMAGLFAERWLFFAEARHAVSLYY
ncbi:MAG: dimethyl sulfoxide reductase anchor subunit [Nitratireductor sp.]|nr:dimethyl sulfoxide reductase anchor subunit [Nitratireductor sp.]